MRPSSLKRATPFLLKFALSSALLLALWPPLSWVYGPLLGSAANVFFAFVRPGVRVEVGDRVCLVYHLWPEALRCEVRDFGAIYLNVLVMTAVFAALPGALRGRLKALGAALLALFASHLLCLYLLSHFAVWNALSGPAPQGSLRALGERVHAFASHHTALVCGRAFALWGAFGWEGLPFLAGALAFGKVRGLFRVRRAGPSSLRLRARRSPAEWGHPARRREAQGPQVRRRVPSPRAHRL